MLSDDDDDDIFRCPVCGEDITDSDPMWRQIHINTCLAKQGKKADEPPVERRCPICNEDLSNLSAAVAEKHVNRCLDMKQRNIAADRSTERCPFCGMCIKNLTPRQKALHDQTCQHANNAQNADVVLYPKVVETLPTPEEWELIIDTAPKVAEEKKVFPDEIEDEMPIIGMIYCTSDVQCLEDIPFFQNVVDDKFDFECCK